MLATCLALLCFAGAVVGMGATLDGYSQSVHPVELLGATGIAHAAGFNMLAFIVPGLLIASVALTGVARGVGMSLASRLGAWIALFSASSFVALGLLPLDATRLDAPANRLHAAAWSLWWLTSATSASLAFAGAGRGRGGHAARLAAAWLVPGFALLAPMGWSAVAQRLAFAAWFAWWLLIAAAISRSAASAPRSSQRAAR